MDNIKYLNKIILLLAMFYISRYQIDKFIRKIRSYDIQISDELRGWNWNNDILSPPSDEIYLGVSELANRYCPTYRDIYLRRVVRRPAPITFKTVRGWIYHAISSRTLTLVKSYIYNSGVRPGHILYKDIVKRERKFVTTIMKEFNVGNYLNDKEYRELYDNGKILFRYLVLQAASYLDKVVSSEKYIDLDDIVNKVVPSMVEKHVDGSPLGLSSNLRIDMMLDNNVVLDIKTGEVRDFHRYTLAGYALAVEADLEKPVDFGVITYLSIEDGFVKVRNDFYFIDEELRREFITIRDEAMEIIESGIDPGKPPKCPSYCIYYPVCNPLG